MIRCNLPIRGDRSCSLQQGMTAFQDIGNNRAIAGGFAPIASQLERMEKNPKGEAEVLSEQPLEKQLDVLSLQHLVLDIVWNPRLRQVFESPIWEGFNIISVSQAVPEEQHRRSSPKIAQTNTTIAVKMEHRVANYFEIAQADIVKAGEIL